MTATLCTLDQALDYRSEVTIRTFLRYWRVSQAHAEELFRETLKWMWFAVYSRRVDDAVVHYVSSPLLDEMLHAFILSTREYHEYCRARLGEYCHHEPDAGGHATAYAREGSAYVEGLRPRIRRTYELVHDTLGPETLRRWYVEYPLIHDDALLERARARYVGPRQPVVTPRYDGPRFDLPRDALIETTLELTIDVWEALLRAELSAGAATTTA